MLQRLCQGWEVQTLTQWKTCIVKFLSYCETLGFHTSNTVKVSADRPGGSSMPGMSLLCEAHVGILSLWMGPGFWQWEASSSGSQHLGQPERQGMSWGERGASLPLYAQDGARCCHAPREISLNSIPHRMSFLAPWTEWLHLRVQGLRSATLFRDHQSREAALASTSGLHFSLIPFFLLPTSPFSVNERKLFQGSRLG